MGAAKEHLGTETLRGIALQLLTQPVERGGEIWAHCPWHAEGTPGNSFSYSPDSDVAYCYSCQGRGDIIDLFAAAHGMEQSQAFVEFMRDHCPGALEHTGLYGSVPRYKRTPQMPTSSAGSTDWSPRDLHRPPRTWREKAGKAMTWGVEQLQQTPEVVEWLRKRGISEATAVRFGLGWIPEDAYRERESWGAPLKHHEDGREKKLWIPKGLVIPYLRQGELQRLRFRRFEQDQLPRYYVLDGSGRAPMWIQRTGGSVKQEAVAVVEAELDGIMLHEQAGDLVHVLALGSSSAKPNDPDVLEALNRSVCILLALDYDQAGQKAIDWWESRYSAAEYWPVPKGKDPGDAYQAGVDIRQWILDGLPPVFHVQKSGDESADQARTAGPSALGGQVESGEGEANGTPSDQTKIDSEEDPVQECARLMKWLGIRAKVDSQGGLSLVEPPQVAQRYWDASQRVSQLVFAEEVGDLILAMGPGSWSGKHLEEVL